MDTNIVLEALSNAIAQEENPAKRILLAEAKMKIMDVINIANPFPVSNGFHHPDSLEYITDYINRYSGQERVVALTILSMCMNYAHQEFFESIKDALGVEPSGVSHSTAFIEG